MDKDSKIYVAGHRGLVGSAIWKRLESKGYSNLIGRTHAELDLMDAVAVRQFFDEEQPQVVVLAAAHVGGIMANLKYRADFIYQNLQIQQNVIGESWRHGVKKLLFLGSTCIYPREAEQPIPETALLTSPLEYTNEPYAIAKIAGLKMCESFNLQYGTNYIAVMPTNLYGPNDNFNLETSHVMPAMIRKMHLAKMLNEGNIDGLRADLNKRPVEGIDGKASQAQIEALLDRYGINSERLLLWGTGAPIREFLWSEDMADASVYCLENIDFDDVRGDNPEVRNCHINIGSGKEITIKQLALLVKDTVGYNGTIEWDSTKPDGTLRKLTDVSKRHSLGWRHTMEIEQGVPALYNWYLQSTLEAPNNYEKQTYSNRCDAACCSDCRHRCCPVESIATVTSHYQHINHAAKHARSTKLPQGMWRVLHCHSRCRPAQSAPIWRVRDYQRQALHHDRQSEKCVQADGRQRQI